MGHKPRSAIARGQANEQHDARHETLSDASSTWVRSTTRSKLLPTRWSISGTTA